MDDSQARLTAALADRYRIERELGQGPRDEARWPASPDTGRIPR